MQEKDIRTWPLTLDGQGEIGIEVDCGAVCIQRVQPGEAPRLELQESALQAFDVEVSQSNNRVRVEMQHRRSGPSNWLEWFTPRRNGLMVYLPDGVAVKVEAEAGKVSVADLRVRRLNVEAEAGSVSLRRVSGDLEVEATAGKIDGEDVSGTLNISSTSGAVRLRLGALDAGEHRVEAEVGAVQVELPQGAEVQVRAEASLGSVRNDFASVPGAAARLKVSANVGSVRVREYALSSQPSAPSRPATTALAALPAAEAGAVALATKAPAEAQEGQLAHVLKMVEEGWISAQDAADILKAMDRR